MSTPFLTLRFALVYARRTATRAYALNGAALVASFAVFRLGANTALLVAIARCVGTDALEASVLDEARQFVAWLHSQGAAQLEGIVMAMAEEERAALASLRDANPTGRGFA